MLADGIGTHQRPVTLYLCTRLRKVGLCFGEACARALGGRGVGRRINTEQWLARFDVAALLEQALLQDARCTSPDFRHAGCLHSAGEFCDEAHVAWGCGDHPDLNGGHLRCACCGLSVGLATRGQQ
ncbi:hypothetical protein D3C71_1748820 [compost metagenome]